MSTSALLPPAWPASRSATMVVPTAATLEDDGAGPRGGPAGGCVSVR